uniref:N-acetyltransferase ESCO2 n=1 Tax=Anthurium amnicola TaxID=1678845 RepID=A0A1D1YG22_9ARAE
MQAKIESFFKPSPATAAGEEEDDLAIGSAPPLGLLVTYTRRRDRETHHGSCDDKADKLEDASLSSLKRPSIGKLLNKKRSYVQYHLELGQSDFFLHTCSICGMKYTRGEEEDEQLHKTFHKNYHEGIPFRGWSHERVIFMHKDNGSRIILVLDCDPPAHKNKVLEIIKVMEGELGLSDGWLLHKLCQVYLFISNSRIVGCIVAEPIKTAHRVVSNSMLCTISDGDGNQRSKSTPCITRSVDAELIASNPTVLRFGNICFQREVIRRGQPKESPEVNTCDSGVAFCEEEAVPALCGIRAVWVVPSKRRQHIATQLLDSVRKNFLPGYMLSAFECAFSQPTSIGKAFASRYSGTCSFLVYKVDDC